MRRPPLVLLAAIVVAAGCSSKPSPGDRPPERLQGAVLFLLDTVRADHLSCYGHGRETSPALARLAARGALFEQVVSMAPWTLPSVRTILSARGVDRAVTPDNKPSASVVESIQRAGYRTAAFTEGGFVSRRFGFDLGFDEYFEEEGAVRLVGAEEPRDETKGGIENTFARAKEWIGRHRGDRFFLLVHTYEPHAPHDRSLYTAGLPPASYGESFASETIRLLRAGKVALSTGDLAYLEALYDGGVHETDRHVGAFLDFLEEIGLGDRTLVVVTSDHGEELDDHYPSHSGDHGYSLHDEMLLVPLVLHNPLEAYPVRRVRPQVRTIDVLPTIADVLGVAVDFPADGASLLPVLRGEEVEGRIAYGGRTRYGPRQAFVRHRGYKYIAVSDPDLGKREPVLPPPPLVQLYDLTSDPGERTNLAGARQDVVAEMARLLAALTTAGGGEELDAIPEQIDPELRERLRSLGYVN